MPFCWPFIGPKSTTFIGSVWQSVLCFRRRVGKELIDRCNPVAVPQF